VSSENIDLLFRGYAAINADEVSDETLASFCTRDLQMANPPTAVTQKTYEGWSGLREWLADFREAFETGARLELEGVIAEGEDFVVSRDRWIGHGSRSGAPLVLRWVNVTWFRDGKLCRGIGYTNRHEALKAVGLTE
jgi:ketosteroid isomerase-like protein